MTRTHNLKCIQPFFDDVASGRKNFEVRRDDRKFAVGDKIVLWCGEEVEGVERWVTYVLRDYPHVEELYVVLGLSEVAP